MVHTHHRGVRLGAILLAVGLATASCTEDKKPTQPQSELKAPVALPDNMGALINGTGPDVTVTRTSAPGVLTPATNVEPTVTGPLVNTAPAQTAMRPNVPTVAPAPSPKVVAPPPKEEINIPKDAKWTILCAELGGPGHGERAKMLKDTLAASTGLTRWYVVHEDDKSLVYYGFYRTIDHTTQEGMEAQRDRATLQSSTTSSGDHPLQLASFRPVDRPAPEAPADWDLGKQKASKNDDTHFWSLQVAAFTADATDTEGHDRKWAAVESAKALRAQGIQAYYYHGDAVSSVCVGVWPAGAVKKQSGGNPKGNAAADNANQSIFVSNAPLPSNMVPARDASGKPIRSLVPRVEIIDPSMYEMVTRFPSHAINGQDLVHQRKNPKTGQVETVSEPSMLVLVPDPKEASLDSIQQQLLTDQNTLQLLPSSALGTDQLPAQKGVGKLRSVGQ
jgi:hypothetical protein